MFCAVAFSYKCVAGNEENLTSRSFLFSSRSGPASAPPTITQQKPRQDKQNEVLVTNSSLNEKQMDLEQIRGAVKRAEHNSEQEGERVKGVCRESGQVMLAINNLHSRYRLTAGPGKHRQTPQIDTSVVYII